MLKEKEPPADLGFHPSLLLNQMAKLSSLAIYFDTDATTIVGQGRAETISNFSKLVHPLPLALMVT